MSCFKGVGGHLGGKKYVESKTCIPKMLGVKHFRGQHFGGAETERGVCAMGKQKQCFNLYCTTCKHQLQKASQDQRTSEKIS